MTRKLRASTAALSTVLGIILIMFGFVYHDHLRSELRSDLDHGRRVMATVIEINHGKDYNTYRIEFYDGGRRTALLTPFSGDPDLQIGQPLSVVINDKTPPTVVSDELLTSRAGPASLETILICLGAVLALLGTADTIRGLRRSRSSGPSVSFPVTFRGYDRRVVDVFFADIQLVENSGNASHRKRNLRYEKFPVRMRGYDRDAVDSAIRRAINGAGEDGTAAQPM